MTDITDAEAAEVLWASSDEGKAAVKAAWEKRGRLGVDLDRTDIGAIVYAAYLAAGWDAEPMEDEPAPAHDHHWNVRGTQADMSVNPTGGSSAGAMRTIVLQRCEGCGEVKTVILVGSWDHARVSGILG